MKSLRNARAGCWWTAIWSRRIASLASAGLVWLVPPSSVVALDLASPLPELAAASLGREPGMASVARWQAGRIDSATVRNPPAGVAAPTAGASAPAAAGFGPAQGEPLYEIGSISKVYTGLLLAQANEAGELRLDDTLGELLRGQLTLASPAVAAISLRQLVSHTACLPRQFGQVNAAAAAAQIRSSDRAALWAALSAQTLTRPAPCPGLYSNYGLAVLGELIAQRLGRPWIDLVRQRILEPLGLRDTMLALGEQAPRLAPGFAGQLPAAPWTMAAYAPAGGLRATASDLARFGHALLQGRQGPLGVAAERVLQPLAAFDGAAIGHAVFILGPESRRTWTHDGLTGGHRALLVLAPDSGEVFAALVSNSMAPLPRVGSELLRARYPVVAQPVPADGLPMSDYPGAYGDAETRRFEVALADGALHLRSMRGVYQRYLPTARDRFARPAGGASLRFERDAQGRIESLRLEQAGRVFQARRGEPAEPARVLGRAEAAAYLGRYQMARLGRAPLQFDVAEEAGQLIVRSSSVDWQAVLPVAGHADRFRYDVPAFLQFERDAQGRVQALVLHEGSDRLRALRDGASPPAVLPAGRD